VDRAYDRRHSLCCGGPLLSRGDREESMRIGQLNLDDAREHGAQVLSFLCPMCNQTLRRVCDAYEMPRHAVSDLCHMALAG
jgi:Fe-S oxidoreductase